MALAVQNMVKYHLVLCSTLFQTVAAMVVVLGHLLKLLLQPAVPFQQRIAH
jgi:hypothetical protein